jgi:photosystem II stability/assembly factor-like uncharacterized protein
MNRRFLIIVISFFTAVPAFAQNAGWTQFPNSPGPSGTRHDDIYFTDPTNGWATQNNFIYRTTNAGVTWQTVLDSVGTHFRSIGFATPMVGFAGNLGPGSYDSSVTDTNVMYSTFNGGVTWTPMPSFTLAGMKGLCSIYVLDSQHIYGAGRVRGPAFVIASANGGTNWTMFNLTASNVMNGIMDIYFSDTNNGWVVGMDTNQYAVPPYYGRIAHTTNGGASWQVQVTTSIADCYFWKMSWPSTNIGYVSLQQNGSYNTLVFYKTTDGGNTWVSNGIPETSIGLNTNGYNFYVQGLGFVSTNEGWIGGASGFPSSLYPNSFIHTTNGGATWTPAGFNDTFYINRIRFMNTNLGFASGGNLYLYSAPLAISNQPASQTVIGPTNVTFTVTPVGTAPYFYQWKSNSVSIPNANGQTYTIPAAIRADDAAYSVYVTNLYSSIQSGIQSSNAVLTVFLSQRFARPQVLPGNQIQLIFNDADGGAMFTTNDLATFTVLASTNLNTWFAITNALSLTNGSAVLTDTMTNVPQKYYQVLEQ